MEEAIVLGLLQGIFEWLPVSSQGVIVAVHSLLFDGEVAEGIGYSLWLHIGTVPSVLVAFRKETAQIVGEVLARPTKPSPLVAFLVVSTVVSGVVGLPLVLFLTDLSESAGSAVMVVLGVALLITGALQITRRNTGARARDDLEVKDGLLAGVSQGLGGHPGSEPFGGDRRGAPVARLRPSRGACAQLPDERPRQPGRRRVRRPGRQLRGFRPRPWLGQRSRSAPAWLRSSCWWRWRSASISPHS